MSRRQQCTATSHRSGQQCKKWAVNGATVCLTHGGAAPQVRAAARERHARERAEAAVATYGLPREVDPHDALLEEVHRTAGHVAWLGDIIADLDREHLTWGLTEAHEKQATEFPGVDVKQSAAPNVWLELYHRERGHLVKVAKACIDAGIDERRVQLAEQQGALIVQVVRATLSDLGVDLTEDVAATVGRHLRAVG